MPGTANLLAVTRGKTLGIWGPTRFRVFRVHIVKGLGKFVK